MGYGSASYNQQSGSSSSSQGLTPEYRQYFSAQTPSAYARANAAAQQAQADPGGLAYQNVVNQLLPIGRYGLPTGATEGTYQLGRDLFTQASGSRAKRGFTQPENLEAVLGDAVRMASGQLIPQSTQVALQRAQMAPALQQSALGYGTAPIQTLQQLLAGSGQTQQQNSGFGFSAAGAGGSDRRLKSNIVRIGTHPLGIGWYKYSIFGIKTQGVMADELLVVKPEAVYTGSDGYYRVKYDLIGRL